MLRHLIIAIAGASMISASASCSGRESAPASTSYDDLVTLFR